jgi:hypothetical protein
MRWVDRRQYPAFGLDVSQRPTQINRLLKVKVRERVFNFGHCTDPTWCGCSTSIRFCTQNPENEKPLPVLSTRQRLLTKAGRDTQPALNMTRRIECTDYAANCIALGQEEKPQAFTRCGRRVRKSMSMKCTQPRLAELRPRCVRRKSKCAVPKREQKFCCCAATEAARRRVTSSADVTAWVEPSGRDNKKTVPMAAPGRVAPQIWTRRENVSPDRPACRFLRYRMRMDTRVRPPQLAVGVF